MRPYDKYPRIHSTKITGIGIPISHKRTPRPIIASALVCSRIVNGKLARLFQSSREGGSVNG